MEAELYSIGHDWVALTLIDEEVELVVDTDVVESLKLKVEYE